MHPCCYIIHSDRLDQYYVGASDDLSNRVEMHNKGFSPFTSKTTDWKLYHMIECPDSITAKKIESHIKSMKSRTYIENLARYPGMSLKLIERFSP
jgi:putative endonuclease